MAELVAEGKMAKVRQYCLAREGSRHKIRCCGDIESVTDENTPKVGNERLNAGPCLSGGDVSFRLPREFPKVCDP
jgi:hypothetical protein